MNQDAIDRLARLVGSGQSRRRILKTLTGGTIGALTAAIGLSGADAAKLRSVGNSCNANADCASGLCVQEARTRKICHCRSVTDCPASDQCRTAACVPTGYCGTSANTGAPCDDGNLCTTSDRCQANGTCAGTPVVCTGPNECYTAGACQPGSGLCSAAIYRGDGASCSGGMCVNGVCCAPLLSTCASDGACCSGSCVNNLCCKGTGAACTDDPDCCGTLFCVYGICGCVSESQSTTCSGKCGPQINNCGQSVDCGACCTRQCGAMCGGQPDGCGGICTDCTASGATNPACEGGTCCEQTVSPGSFCSEDVTCCQLGGAGSRSCISGSCCVNSGFPTANDNQCCSGHHVTPISFFCA